MKRRSLLGSFLGVLGGAALAPKQALLPLPPPAAPSLGVLSAPEHDDYLASITSGTDGQVLRRTKDGLAWGSLDLADCDAVTELLPFSNLCNPNRG